MRGCSVGKGSDELASQREAEMRARSLASIIVCPSREAQHIGNFPNMHVCSRDISE